LRRPRVPGARGAAVLRSPEAFLVQVAERVHRLGVAGLRRLRDPFERSGEIALHDFAVVVQPSDARLRARVAAVREIEQPRDGGAVAGCRCDRQCVDVLRRRRLGLRLRVSRLPEQQRGQEQDGAKLLMCLLQHESGRD